MACNQSKVFLGFDDEPITANHKSTINFTTNKIGGKPDWPSSEKEPPVTICCLCGLNQLLVLQIYAPLENSPYHRTLYLLACINPNCWNQSESWTCVRTQTLDKGIEMVNTGSSTNAMNSSEWCQEADDWGDDTNDNISEENGNLINRFETYSKQGDQRSEDEDESYSFDDSLRTGLEELYVDNKNANNGTPLAEAQGGGAVGRLQSPIASAEIEGDESEVVSIDTPTAPTQDIIAMLQEVAPLPAELCQKPRSGKEIIFDNLQFCSLFISVSEENLHPMQAGSPITDHVRELLNEYQMQHDSDDVMNDPLGTEGDSAQGDSITVEKYEKTMPAHGDTMFHYFITKIQKNPGQILRYSRDGLTPLLLSPLTDIPKCCYHCHGNMQFELQVLPTLIPKLQLTTASNKEDVHLEFGTVLIFTCQRSCWAAGDITRREFVIVQSERF